MKLGKLGLLLLSITALLSGSALADQPVNTHTFELAPEIYYHNYEEPRVMEQEGVFYGLRSDYEFRQDRIFLRAELNGAIGQVDYSSPVSGTMDDIDDWLFESRGTTGYDFHITRNIIAAPYVGIAYRYLNDDSAGRRTNTGAAGYERESNYIYSPIGLMASLGSVRGWNVRASGEYDLFWMGRQESHLGDAISGLNTLENDQDSGYGLRGGLALEKTGKSVDWWVESFVRYWSIDDSDIQPITFLGQTIGLGFEPENETIEIGGSIGARF